MRKDPTRLWSDVMEVFFQKKNSLEHPQWLQLVTCCGFANAGTQTLMGMEGEWCLNWNMDGRFFEQFDGIEMTMEWAYDGEDEPWGGDAAGRITIMDLDDREVFFFSHCFQLKSLPFLMSSFLGMKRGHSVCFCYQEGPILVLASSAKCMAWTYVSLMIS